MPKQETVELTKKEAILDETTWQEALNTIKKHNNTLYSVARMASPTFTDNTVTLTLSFPFHQKRLDEPKNKQIIAEVLGKLMGGPVSIACILDASHKATKSKITAKKPKNDDLDTISNIFGGAEVVD